MSLVPLMERGKNSHGRFVDRESPAAFCGITPPGTRTVTRTDGPQTAHLLLRRISDTLCKIETVAQHLLKDCCKKVVEQNHRHLRAAPNNTLMAKPLKYHIFRCGNGATFLPGWQG
jgi:hypothetical protein